MQVQKMEKPRVLEQCGQYYIQERDFTIKYEILISLTKINPFRPFGKWMYVCALWDIHENKKSEFFPVFGNSRDEARQKIAQKYEHYLKIQQEDD